MQEDLKNHPFLSNISPEFLGYYEECAANETFKSGDYLVREKEAADDFFLIRSGKIALDTFIAGRGPTNIQYITGGEVLGWSWLVEPNIWQFNALAVEPTEVIRLNGTHLKTLADKDCAFGYDLMRRMVNVVGLRLRMTMLQLK
ncbi:MAG: cyclic nucleotide-binding domain-containing protein [Anaerolineae bacterium]|nr:cyclic nucleotide-binding domain-containing protein [Anaerolineae bacterium]